MAHALTHNAPITQSVRPHDHVQSLAPCTSIAGDAFYIVREGVAVVRDGAKELARLGPGQFFGERALLGAEVRAADVVADGRLVCYCLSRTDFDTLLGSKDEVWRYEALTNVSLYDVHVYSDVCRRTACWLGVCLLVHLQLAVPACSESWQLRYRTAQPLVFGLA